MPQHTNPETPPRAGSTAEAGENFKINLFAGASTGEMGDGILVRADIVAWRRPYMSDTSIQVKLAEG